MNFINYKVVIRNQVHDDIYEFADYIFRFSFSESISKNISDVIYEKINWLNFMPHMYQKVLWEYRVALVKKTYRIFYRVEEENKKVIIVRVIRTDQNIEEILFD